MSAVAVGNPAWRWLPAGEGEDGEHGHAGSIGDDRGVSRGVATFDELAVACDQLEVRCVVREMGLRAKGLTHESLRANDPIEEGGVATFLNGASATGALLL